MKFIEKIILVVSSKWVHFESIIGENALREGITGRKNKNYLSGLTLYARGEFLSMGCMSMSIIIESVSHSFP